MSAGEWILGIMLLICILLIGTAVFLLKQMRKRLQYYKRQQKKLFSEYYVALDRQDTIVRQMGHDISRYLRSMKQFAEMNDREQMDILSGNLKEEYGKYQCADYCTSRMVNALLYRKLEVCRQHKIRTQIELTQFDGGYVENTEWLVLFFNLFENAIEACQKVESGRERFIHVKAKCAGGFEVIVFRNSKMPAPENEKKKKMPGGLGLHILKEIAEKYGGAVICKEEGDVFQTTVSLQVRDKRQEKVV